jgi:hypothetical protein
MGGGWRHTGNQLGADTEINYTLLAGVPLIAVTEDLIPRLSEQLRRRGGVGFGNVLVRSPSPPTAHATAFCRAHAGRRRVVADVTTTFAAAAPWLVARVAAGGRGGRGCRGRVHASDCGATDRLTN